MAVLISQADANLTGASAWATVEGGAGASQTTKSANTNTTTSYVYSSAFTGTNLNVCDGILVYGRRLNTTGTVSFALSEDNGTTATREVTINASDLPVDNSWIFIKFGSSLTLDGGTDYKVGIKGSSAGNATFYRDGTAGNWTRILRLTALATAAAGDVMYIVGEHTAAGATTTRTITMNSTATTDYGTGTDGTDGNGVEIGDAGILQYGTSAATNYYLKLSGSLNIWGNATLNIGTTGTPIPRGSSAVLEFDPVADGGMGLILNAGGTFNSQGLSRTSAKDIWYCKLNTDEAANSTSLGVDTDTGWLDNDVIAVASTTRTATQTETGALNGNAGASSLTVDGFGGAGGGLANAHDGTSPIQAEIILLTRNIEIRSASSTVMAYVFLNASAVDIDWTSFKYLGENAANKRGVEISNASVNLAYCVIQECEDFGLYLNAAPTITNLAIYNIGKVNVANTGSITASSTNLANVSNIIAMGPSSASVYLFYLTASPATLPSGLTVAGLTGSAVFFNVTNGILDLNNATIHSCSAAGVTRNIGGSTGVQLSGTIKNATIWRINTSAIAFATSFADAGIMELTIENITAWGCNTQTISFGAPDGDVSFWEKITFINFVTNGDSSFSTTSGITLGVTGLTTFRATMINCDFSSASGIKTAHTNDILVTNGAPSGGIIEIVAKNSKFGGTNVVNESGDLWYWFLKSQKHGQTAGDHRKYSNYGRVQTDSTASMYRTAAPSVRMTPSNASNKIDSGSFKVNVNSGQTCTPSVYVRESVAGDGTDYNGARPRLILKRNDAIGITSDTVIDTATISSEGAFEQLTGTTAAATDDGVMEFIVDCDGTTGWVNVDDFSATVA